MITVAFALELAIIVAAAAGGTTSHFNVSTPRAYVGVVMLVTWQALRGQSIVRPDAYSVAVAERRAGEKQRAGE